MIELQSTAEGILLPVYAQPRARTNGVLGAHAGRLKVAVTAAPDKGKANAALVQVLAEALRLKPAQISLVVGASSRQKKFLLTGIAESELAQRIDACLRE